MKKNCHFLLAVPVFLAVCACWYVCATALSVRIAGKRFEQLDLQL